MVEGAGVNPHPIATLKRPFDRRDHEEAAEPAADESRKQAAVGKLVIT
jgi:hypothetical protein